MSLFSSFRILLGILLSPSLLSRFIKEIMLETSVLSVGVITDDSIFKGEKVKGKIFLANYDGGLNIYSNFAKSVIQGLSNVRRISDCFVINYDSIGKSMVRVT